MKKKTTSQVKQEVNEALLSDLLALYSHAEEQMLKKVAKRVAKGITEEGWNEIKAEDTSELRKEISALLTSPTKSVKTMMGKNILKAYKEGVNGVEKEAGKPLTAMSQLDVPLSIQNLLLANYNLIDDANSNILRKVDDAYREYMTESASMLLAGVETRAQASQRMMDKLAAKGITTFVDKAGRTWDMGSYTEMAMRTASAHAALEGRIQTQQSLGNDLMQVSRIGTTCPICAKWQGVVLSISGKTPGYHTVDQARAAGLFHPNCRHTMIMWDEELDGEGQKELNSDAEVNQVTKTYFLTQQQRANERMIRHWKRRAAGAIDPVARAKYNEKANQWTFKNIAFCETHGLVRLPAREGVKNPNSQNAQFIDWFGKHLMGYSEYEMAKVVLDEATLKQLLKDKSESLTTLYKKYIGENPSQDYKSVGDTQLTYAQWLKAKVMELTQDMPDPEEVKYITIPAKYTEAELKALLKTKSLTEVYKENISGSPSQDYKNSYSGPLTYAQWLKAQVGDLTMEKVVPANMTEQGQNEIGIAKGTNPLGDKPLDGAVQQISSNVVKNLLDPKNYHLFSTKIEDVYQGAFWADESAALEMDKKGQFAVVKNGKVYFNPHKESYITANTLYHELGHLMSVKGLKATTKDFKDAADEMVASLGYKNFKSMAKDVSLYAQTNPQEFFAEAFMMYHSPLYDQFSWETKTVVAEAMKKMYLKQGNQPTPAQQAVDFQSLVKEGKAIFEKAYSDFELPTYAAIKAGFIHSMGYEVNMSSDTEAYDSVNSILDDNAELFDLWLDVKAYIEDNFEMTVKSYVNYDPDAFFDKDFLGEYLKKSPKLKDVVVENKAEPVKAPKASKVKAANPKDLVTETDKENFAKAKQIWDDKIAKDGAPGFGSTKAALAQVFGLDIHNPHDEAQFGPMWDAFKKTTKDKGKSFSGIADAAKKLFDYGKIEDLLALNPDHPIAKAKAQEQAEQEAIAKAKAEAKAKAQAQAMAAAVQAAKGASGYKLGHGTLSEQEQSDFIAEHKEKHLYGGSSEGKAQAKRLKDAQKAYAKHKFGVTSLSKSQAQSLEAEVARALRENDTEALKKVGPIWALYDYSKASGVYNWYKRGVNRSRGVSMSDHPLGRGMTEWEYGEKLAPLIDEYFKDMPGLEEDVYVHRVFGEDALQNLFGIESDKAKAAIELGDALKYAKKHPGETLIRDKGYLSTSTFTEGDWNGNCEIRIKLNKGTKAAYLGGVEAHNVDEMLIQANQKMRVNAVYDRADYTSDEWYKLASEKGFNPSKKVAIFAETVLDEDVSVVRDVKEIQIGEMLKNQSSGASSNVVRSELSSEYASASKVWKPDERKGLKEYTGSDFRWMNKALRERDVKSRPQSQQEQIKSTKAALDKVRTTQDRAYRRGSDFDALISMLGEDPSMTSDTLVKKLREDPEYFNSGTRIAYDDGFLSTSPMLHGGFTRKVEFRIFAPAGTKAVYVDPLSLNKGELETLFQAGTKFRVVGLHYLPDMLENDKKAKELLTDWDSDRATFVCYLEALADD